MKRITCIKNQNNSKTHIYILQSLGDIEKPFLTTS